MGLIYLVGAMALTLLIGWGGTKEVVIVIPVCVMLMAVAEEIRLGRRVK